VLFIVEVIVSVIGAVFIWIPVVGMIIGYILWILVLILWILGIINSLTDKKTELPVIGSFGEKFNF